MKKIFLIILSLFYVTIICAKENITYVLTNDCSSYKIDIDNHETKKLNKNQKITCIPNLIDAFEDQNTVIGPFFYNKEDYYLVPVYSLRPVESEDLLPENIISINNNGITKRIIPTYFWNYFIKKIQICLGNMKIFS